MKEVNVGVIGLGTVGSGVVDALIEKRNAISLKAGANIRLKKIFDKDKRKMYRSRRLKSLAARNISEIIDAPDIDIVVELIGLVKPAKNIISESINNNKHVVTANKALLSESLFEIMTAANNMGVCLGYEASVAGAIPIIKALTESFSANKISALYGIVNGTCNFILSKMGETGCSFDEALLCAQKKGLAEAKPALDINGIDSAHKLCILAKLVFGLKNISSKQIYTEGIRHIYHQDIMYARAWGYDIKLLAIAKKIDNMVQLRVHPTLVPMSHLLSNVQYEDNAVFVKGDMIGESMFYGKGAGRLPAASAVTSDIVDIAKHIANDRPNASFNKKRMNEMPCEPYKLEKIGELNTRYYLRFQAIDKPGVLAKISDILAQNSISIALVSQKGRKKGQVVPIVMLTHEAKEKLMVKALNEIDRLKFIKHRTIRIRIESRL